MSDTMIAVADTLAPELEAAAAALDREGRSPAEHYERMRGLGYLRGPVPLELGGLGADLAEVVAAQRTLGGACASTALAVNMHLFQVGAAAERWRTTGDGEAVLRRVAEDGAVLGSTGAEAVVAGAWDTDCVARPVGDDLVVSGRKRFCSQAELMDVVRVNARDAITGDILVLAVPASVDGVRVESTWDALGMRATASDDLVLDDAHVPLSAVAARLPAHAPAWHPGFAAVIRWFLCGVAAVYVGIADRARDESLRAAHGGGNSAHRAPALTDALVGHMERTHLRATAVLEHAVAGVLGSSDPVEGMVLAIAGEQESTEAASDVVDRAVAVVGARAYHRRSVLERLVRDVRAARHHPPAAPVGDQMVGMRRTGRAPVVEV